MKKILSTILSLSILFTSIAPSYGQALESVKARRVRAGLSSYEAVQDNTRVAGVEQRQAAMEVALEKAQVQAAMFGGLPQEVKEAVAALQGEGQVDEEAVYGEYKAAYVKMMQGEMAKVLQGAASEEERAAVKAAYEDLVKESAIKRAYEKDMAVSQKEAEEAGKEYIKGLVARIYEAGQSNPVAVLGMVEEGLPVFNALGLVDNKVKVWASGVLRKEIEQKKGFCEAVGFLKQIRGKAGEQSKGCEAVLKAVGALVVLGEGGRSADTEVIAEVLREGHNGTLGTSVIMVAGSGLLAMGATDQLVSVIYEVAERQPSIGLFGKDFSFISFQDWVKASKAIWENGDWAVGHEYSFYKGEGEALGNAWTDLGEYLGQQSVLKGEEGAKAREVLDRIAGQTVVVGEGGFLHVNFPVFMAGAIAGGYQVKDMGRSGWELMGDGRSVYRDTRKNWDTLLNNIKKEGITLTGYTAASLYYKGKSDLDPYTKLAVNNKLAQTYRKSGSKVSLAGLVVRGTPTDEEIASYKNWKRASGVAGGLDVALMVAGVVTLGVGLVKAGAAGVRAIGQMGKAFRIARAGTVGQGVRATAAAYQRVVRIGRLQKYGTGSLRQIFINRLGAVNGAARMKLEAPVKELRAAEAAKAKPVELSAEQIKANGAQWVRDGQAIEEAKAAQSRAWYAEQKAKQEAAAAAAQEAPLSGPAVVAGESRAPAYRQVTVRNALGQEVKGWEPVSGPVEPTKPSLWKHFSEAVSEKISEWGYDLSEIGKELLGATKRKMAAAYLAASMSLTPIPSVGAQGVLRAEQGLNSLVRTEQVINTAARGGAVVESIGAANAGRGVVSSAEAAQGATKAAAAVQSVSGTGKAVSLASANPLSNLVKLAGMNLFGGNAAGESAPVQNGILGFVPVAVTPESERQLGLGNFFKFNRRPQFLVNFYNELQKYQAQKNSQGEPDKALAAFNRLQEAKTQHALGVQGTKMYWERQGYPVTGQMQAALQHGFKGAYLYGVAPLLYRNNPYYQAYNQQQEERAQAVAAEKQALAQSQYFISNGKFNASAFEEALSARISSALVLSANGLGTWSDKLTQRSLIKKITRLVQNSYQSALAEAAQANETVAHLFAKHVMAGFAAQFGNNPSADVSSLKQNALQLLGLPFPAQNEGPVKNLISPEEVFRSDDNYPADGFKLTYINPQTNQEEVLPVVLSIDSQIKTRGYNRITFNEKFHAQLRDGNRTPATMSHFFMRFAGTSAEWNTFMDLVKQADLKEPFHIKLQHKPNRVFKANTVTLYEEDGRTALPVEVEIEKKYLPGEARLVLMRNGQFGVLRPFEEIASPLSDVYIRIPKHQIKNLVQILKNSKQVFPIQVSQTRNKAILLYLFQQIYNNSLGKTMGPIIHQDLGISSASATSLMMIINYVIPGLASFLNPVLRRMGEKRLSVLSGFMTSLSNFLPPLAGFYGLAHDHSAGDIAVAVIVTAFILRSAASVLQQVTSNMLVAANSGKIKEDAKKLSVQHKQITAQKTSWKDVVERIKAVWTHKTSPDAIRNLLMYNLSFVYKNLGTLLFLALPWLLNKAVFLLSGYNADFVYSISFPIFGVYALIVTLQTLRTNLRDAYSVPTIAKSQKALEQMVSEVLNAVYEAALDPETTFVEMHDLLDIGAGKLRERVTNLVEAERLEGAKKDNLPAIRAQILQQLQVQLKEEIEHGARFSVVPESAREQLAETLTTMLHMREQQKISTWEIFAHAPAVAAITFGMTLASVHEFTISSAFAMNLNQLIASGATANLLVAIALYIPLIAGRLGGNVLATRISSGTMYLFCNALSGLGTLIMLGSAGNVGMSVLGAAITSLGVGNYFSQMYDYVTKKNPQFQREISVILAITMALAGGLTVPASHLNAWFGGTNLDIWYALAALAASWLLTLGMMDNSTIVKFMKSTWNTLNEKLFRKSTGQNAAQEAPGAVTKDMLAMPWEEGFSLFSSRGGEENFHYKANSSNKKRHSLFSNKRIDQDPLPN